MSEPLDLWFWGRLFAIMIAGTGGLALVAKVITRSVGDPYLNRAIWRFCIAGFMAVTLYVVFGVKLSFPEERRVPIVQEELQPQEASQTATIKTLSIAPRTVTPREVEPNILWPLGMWVVGSVLFLCRIFYGVSKLTLLKGRELQQGIIATDQITTPISYGLFRPRIAVPGNFEQQFNEAEQKIIIAHERAHLKAGDPWWYLIVNIICATFWWNPAAWWAFRNLQDSSELAADACACTSPADSILLADSLVRLARETCSVPSALSVLGQTSNLKKRIEALLRNECSPLTSFKRNLLKTLLVLCLIVTCFTSAAWTGRKAPIDRVYVALQADDSRLETPASIVQQVIPPRLNADQKFQTKIFKIHTDTVVANLLEFGRTNTVRFPRSEASNVNSTDDSPDIKIDLSKGSEVPTPVYGQSVGSSLNPALPRLGGREPVSFVTRSNSTAVVNQLLLDYFQIFGINTEPPNSVFLNDKTGQIFVHGAAAEAEVTLRAVERLAHSTSPIATNTAIGQSGPALSGTNQNAWPKMNPVPARAYPINSLLIENLRLFASTNSPASKVQRASGEFNIDRPIVLEWLKLYLAHEGVKPSMISIDTNLIMAILDDESVHKFETAITRLKQP